MKPVVKALVIVLFLAMTAGLGYNASTITTGFELVDLSPDTSYLREKIVAEEETFGGFNQLATDLHFHHDTTSFESVEESADVQAKMSAITKDVINLPTMLKVDANNISTVDSWHDSFTKWALAQPQYSDSTTQASDGRFYVTGAKFYPALNQWLTVGLNERYLAQIRCEQNDGICEIGTIDPQTNKLTASRVGLLHDKMPTSEEQVDGLVSTQRVCEKSDLEPKPFVYSYAYIFFDQFRIISGDLMQNFGLCLIAITLICAVVIVHPCMCLLVTVVMLMIDVDLVGVMLIFGLELNSITAINLVMAVGLVVDYSAHIVHNFTMQDSSLSRDERTIRTLVEIGPSVLLGVTTTLLGLVPCALANSEVFRVFFKMFVGIVFFGGTHGLILFPVMLSLVGMTVPGDVAAQKDVELKEKGSEP